MSGFLLFQKKENNEEKCDFDFICNNCKKRNSCTLPEAKENQLELNSENNT